MEDIVAVVGSEFNCLYKNKHHNKYNDWNTHLPWSYHQKPIHPSLRVIRRAQCRAAAGKRVCRLGELSSHACRGAVSNTILE